jgi:hypothetical protein
MADTKPKAKTTSSRLSFPPFLAAIFLKNSRKVGTQSCHLASLVVSLHARLKAPASNSLNSTNARSRPVRI